MRLAASLLILLLPEILAAQSSRIHGVVRIRADNSVIAGAMLEVAGSSVQAVSGPDGRFVLMGLARTDSVRLHVSRFGIRSRHVTVATARGEIEILVEAEAVAIPQVAVTGTRDAVRETSPFQVLTVESDGLTLRGDLTLSDVLRRVPGITISGLPGDGRELRMRGMGSEYTQVLVDGQPLANMSDRRVFQLDRLPLALVDRLVILRNTTARTPSRAVAGSVNILLRPIPVRSTFGWDVNVGSGDPSTGTAVMGGAGIHFGNIGDRLGYVVSAAVDQHRNPRSHLRLSARAGGADIEIINESLEQTYDEVSFAPRISYGLGGSALTLSSLYVRGTEQRSADRIMGSALAPIGERDAEKTRYDTWRMQLGWTPASTAIGFVVGADGMHDSKAKTWDRAVPNALLPDGETDTKDELDFYANARWQLELGRHILRLGSDASARQRSKDRTRFEVSPDGTLADLSRPSDHYEFKETEAAAFIEGEFELWPAAVLSPGLRVEALKTTTRDWAGNEGEHSGALLIPVLNVLIRLDNATNLRGAFNRTVRRPRFDNLVDFSELRGGSLARPDLAGNSLLNEERALSFEATIERFGAKGTTLGITALTKSVRDRIEPTVIRDEESGRYVEMPVNAGDGRMYGVEMDGMRGLPGLRGVSAWGNLSLYHSRITDPATGEQRSFNRQPSYVLNLGADANFRRLGMRAGASLSRMPATTRVESSNGTRQSESDDIGDVVSAYLSKTLGGVVLSVGLQDLMEAERARSRTTTRPDGSLISTTDYLESGQRRFLVSLRTRVASPSRGMAAE